MTATVRFADDVAFLSRHIDVVVLGRHGDCGRVAVTPNYQGRVMTSACGEGEGRSHGWLNRTLIASGELQPHFNAYGGEDRFWLGPEGGQYSIFFAKGAPFDLEHWQTPSIMDTEPFQLETVSDQEAVFSRTGCLTNYQGSQFEIGIRRTVRLLPLAQAEDAFRFSLPDGVKLVAYESDNALSNLGGEAWTKAGGLLSIWILGMFNPSPQTTVVLPFVEGPESTRGPKVNDAYFGKVPNDRMAERGGVLYFKGDGTHRSKIGLSPQRAKDCLGSFDATHGVLTVVQYNRPDAATDYVNSMWEIQANPYAGDVVNTYNDGPPAPGVAPLGPFYELETSSPAAALGAGETMRHLHRTLHLEGDHDALDSVARQTLGVGLDQISAAFNRLN